MSRHSLFRFAPASATATLLAAALMLNSAMAEEYDTLAHDISITVDEIAALDFSSASAVSFQVVAPDNAGDIPKVQASNTHQRLFYTSVVKAGESRNITVAHDNSIPDGLSLALQANLPSGVGTGALGSTFSGDFQNSAAIDGSGSQVVVNGIGTGFTGTGSDSGVTLVYDLSVTTHPIDIRDLFTHDGDVTLTYTMSVGN